ncbi:MAG: hypothetical protein A2087_08195 [Spirochaetes bacterium GWD1_61_31]|nr:MAG: hypothetical protein A2Y37_12370 [Spirochaetes bacterium GWB1_60_80]OHD30164.1 MAG: hypothetical protein A2004_14235 [Spirochaetes bacterium GWC1_61_12]OHD39887.1 MAG: hypothetical protein A2087_08195 [Spirochaetes bacterium GWD1_61_31]OHD46396.1 MAG: hypothetical protein A2Y35_10050 [Spirochaetes bacterium GWE1_60_18]OHD59452.1 MAG: hypothetical protein A2Y32_10005 [Spirochaetes bacterium GWF1_60_12]HAP43558.1 hypothetical protein [Spirochaetaceae bacterium]
MNTTKTTIAKRGASLARGLLLTALVVFLSTCDIPFGLGSQVDTGAPRVTIDTPTRNGYYKGQIVISGTATDDIEVARVQVIVKRGTTIVKDIDAAISGETWTYSLDTGDGSLDGELTVTANAIDGFGKATETIIPIFVDNTPPTVLVTSPVTLNSVMTDYIDLKGEVYDQSPVSLVEVELLNLDGTVLAGPTRADGTNTWAIRFLLKDTIAGLPLPGEGTRAYKYRVYVTDGSGNRNSYYFHRTGIIAQKNSTAPFPSMDEIGRIDQNNLDGDSGITVAELESIRLISIANYAGFTYDPDPQIDFQFTNIVRIADSGSAEINLLAPNSKITGLITPPPESGAVEESSVVVRIYEYLTENLITEISQSSNPGNLTMLPVSSSISFAIALKDGVVDLASNKYKMTISAATDTGITKTSNMEEFTIDAEAPMFEESNLDPDLPDSQYQNAPFSMRFSGSHSTALVKIEIFQSFEGGAFVAIPEIDLPDTISFADQLSVALPFGTTTNGRYNYRAILHTVSGKTTTILRSVTYDTVAPVVTINSFNSFVPSTTSVNGMVEFYATSSEKYGIEETKYYITLNDSAPAFDAVVGGNIVQILANQEIDTTSLPDSSTYYLWVLTRDLAGNLGSNTVDMSFDVDQSTDRPTINLTSLDNGIILETAVNQDDNLLVLGGKISGSISDDDGVAAAWLEIDLNHNTNFDGGAERIALTLSGFGTTKTFDYAVSGLTEGTYSFRIDATDTNATPVHNTVFANPVWFGYDTATPTVVFNPNATDSNPVGPYRNADFTVQGTVQDTAGIAMVEFSLDNGSSWTDLGITAAAGAVQPWTRTIAAAANNGAKKLIIRATDDYGRTNQNTAVDATIDTVNPTVGLTPISGYIDTLLNIDGTAVDATSQLAATMEYCVDLNGNAVADDGWTAFPAGASWFKSGIVTSGLAEGAGKLIWIRISDRAGNQASTSGTFTVDHFAPTIAVDVAFDGAVYRNGEFTINGTVTDTNLGASPIAVTATRNSVAHALTNPLTNGTTWSRLINLAGEGNYEITITATDQAGRTSTEKRTIIVDTVDPTVSITSFESYATGSKVNGTVSFSSVSSDANGIDDTKYFVTTAATAPAYGATVDGTIVVRILAGASIDTTTLTDLGTYYLWVVALDKAGNDGANATSLSFQVDQSTDRPVVSLTSLSAGIISEGAVDKDNNLLVLGGKISGSITDDDGVAEAWLDIDLNHNTTFDGGAERIALTLSGFGKTKTFDYAVSGLAEGTYKFRIDALDSNATAIHNTPFANPVWFAYDISLPSVVFNNLDSLGVAIGAYRNADFTVEGTVQDTSGITKVEFSLDNGGNWSDLSLSTTTNLALDWDYPIDAAGNNGTVNLIVRATDRYLRTNQNSAIAVTVDTLIPTMTVTAFAPTYYADTGLAISGTAVDANSGLSLLEYCVDLDGDATADDGWFALNGTASWYKNDIAANLLAEGAGRAVWIRATDMAGNVSVPELRTFTVDHGAPVIAVDAAFDGSVFRNAAFTLNGTVSDGNLPASPISITAKKDGVAHTLTNPISNGATWSRLINLNGDGVYVFTITAVDAFSRSSSVERTVTVDSSQPNLEITSVLPILSGANVNGVITLAVNTSDSNGLTGVKYFLRTDASTPAYGDAIAAPTSGNLSAPYSVQIDTTLLTNSTAYTLWVIARDRAGNDRLVSTTINVNQTSDTPSAAIESPLSTEQLGVDRRLRGSFSDDDGVALSGAVLYIRKLGAPTYTARNLNVTGSAGQQVAWTYDATTDVTTNGDGTYQVYLVVADNAAVKLGKGSVNYTTAVQTFVYDVNPPNVSAISAAPVQGAYAAADVVTLTWTALDSSGIASQDIDIDGVSTGLGAITNPSGDNFQAIYTVPSSGLTSGNKTITLITADGTGRATTRTLTILVDIDPPEVENAYTVNPAFVGSTPNGAFELKGTAYDNRGLTTVAVALSTDGTNYGSYTNATLSSGNWTLAIADSASLIAGAGTLYFRVMATDSADNTSVVREFSQAVNQAADKPVVTLISPVDASSYGTTVQISGTATDDDNLDGVSPLDADAIEIQYWGPLPATTPTTVNPTISGTGKNANFNYSLSGLASGDFVVQSRARDSNNLWGDWSTQAGFTVNAGAPNLSLATVVDTFRNNASLSLSGTVSDGQGVQYVRVRINGAGWTDATGTSAWGAGNVSDTWSATINLGSDGLKTIEIIAADMGDFIANRQLTTTLDATPPAGSFDTQFRDDPSGSYLVTTALNKVVRITGTVTELNLADTNPVEISIAGGGYVPVSGTFVWSYVWDTTSLGNADYELRLRITDKAGNVTASVIKTVTTQQSADVPQISQAFVAAPTANDAGNNLLGALLKVSGTISDDDGFLAGAVNLYLDGSATPIAATNTTGTTATWDYTWGSLAQGQHYYSIQATDRNGQVASLGPTYFLVDTTNPALTVNSPTAGAKVLAGTLTISGSATDAGGLGALPLSISLRHSSGASSLLHNLNYTPTLAGNNFSQNVTIDGNSLDGTLFIDFVLTDRAGKQNSLTRAITIDTTGPVLNLTYPSSGAYMNGFVSFTGTADDLNGLSDVTLQLLAPGTYLPVATIARSGSTLSSWEFPFNLESYATATYGVDVNADGKLFKVLFRLTATDQTGNVVEYKVNNPTQNDWPFFYIDLDGDKPSISVTQPSNGANIGGIVNMFGSSSDDDGPVMRVEVQIDFNGDGDFTDTRDLDGLGGIQTGGTPESYVIGSDTFNVTVGDIAHPWEDESSWYPVSVTNNSWSLELNVTGDLYSANTGGTGYLNIRTRSRDMYGLPSEISTRTIFLDETFPRIENVVPDDKSYQSGHFDLTVDFGDNVNLNLADKSAIRVNINKSGYTTLVPGANSGPGWSGTLTAALGTPQYGYDLALDIDTDFFFNNASGIFYVDLYVKDQSEYVNQRGYTYYIDNQAPTSGWSDRPGAPDGLNLRNGQVRINNNPLYDYAFLEGNYLDSGVVSGVDRVEVYFVKTGTVRRIKGATGSLAALNTSAVQLETYDEGTGIWSDPPLATTLPYAQHSDPGFGNDYVIRIDRATEMSSISTGADSDLDGFFEFMGLDGGAQRFRAYFNSQYLPDGEIDIHYVVYDMAGNSTHWVRRGFIANNGPSYSRIRIGSDYNASDTVVDIGGSVTEIVDYFYPTESIDRLADDEPVTIKNGKLYFAVESTDPNGTIQSTVINVVDPSPGSKGTLTTFSGATGGNVAINPLTPIAITIGSAQFPSAGIYYLEVAVKDNDLIASRRTLVINVLATVDTDIPTLTPIAMTQANAIPLDAGNALGHLEMQTGTDPTAWTAISTAYGSDNDPKASGEINLKGTVFDNNRITSLDVTAEGVGTNLVIANWVGGQLVSADPARLTIDSQGLTEAGHTVTFTYRWNTALVTNSAGLDKTVAFRATDAATLNSAAHTALRFDVVPYISGITTTQITNGGITARNLRAVSGRYSIKTGSTADFVTISGFNLRPIANGVRLSSATYPSGVTGTTLRGAAMTFQAAASPYTTLMVSNTATASGYVNVITGTVGVPLPTVNNLNDNTMAHNQEPDTNNGLVTLHDDRYANFFTVTNTGMTTSLFPQMIMDVDTPVFGYIQGSAANDLQVRRGSTSGGSIGLVRILSADGLGMARDDSGFYHMASVNNFAQGRMIYLYNRFETLYANGGRSNPYWSGSTAESSTNTGNNALDMDSVDFSSRLLSRYQNIQMIARGNSNTAGQYSRVYMAFYDDLTGQVIFRNLRVGQGAAGYDMYNDGGLRRTNYAEAPGTVTDDGRKIVTANGSPHLAMAVTDNNVVVIVFYNQVTGYLNLVYSATVAGGATAAPIDLANPVTGAVYWSTPQQIGQQYTGWYLSMAMENDGNTGTPDAIHLAAYDSATADLRYLYLSDYTDATADVARIDAMNSVGIYTDIKVRAGVPWISYYNNSENGTRDSIRLTRFNGVPATAVTDGANLNGTVTGNWEYMTVPVNSAPVGGNTKFLKTNLGFNSSGHPIIGYAASQIEYTRLLPEITP